MAAARGAVVARLGAGGGGPGASGGEVLDVAAGRGVRLAGGGAPVFLVGGAISHAAASAACEVAKHHADAPHDVLRDGFARTRRATTRNATIGPVVCRRGTVLGAGAGHRVAVRAQRENLARGPRPRGRAVVRPREKIGVAFKMGCVVTECGVQACEGASWRPRGVCAVVRAARGLKMETSCVCVTAQLQCTRPLRYVASCRVRRTVDVSHFSTTLSL